MRARIVVDIAVAVVVSGATLLSSASGQTATVDGRASMLPGGRATVGRLLRSAHVNLPRGVLYSVVRHRAIKGRRSDAAPMVLVNGRRAVLSTVVHPGDRVELRPGSAVEPTTVKAASGGAQPASAVSAPGLVAAGGASTAGSGLPDVERTLWHPGTPGAWVELVGAFSGEVVRETQVTPPTTAQPEADRAVALTFDDGPNPTWTPQVLQILRAESVPATFCVVGRWAAAYPELLRAEVAQGDTICDHTVDHDVALDRATHARVASEIGGDADVIDSIAGVRPRFYRPPGGTLSTDVIATAHTLGLRVVTWSVDPSDYLLPPPDALLSRILSQVRPGAVILLHDGGGFRAHTVGVLGPLIEALKAQGYRFTTPAAETPSAPSAA